MKIVIPSGSQINLEKCLTSLIHMNPELGSISTEISINANVIVVGDRFSNVQPCGDRVIVQGHTKPISIASWIEGPQPFSVSRNINLGLSKGGDDDVFLCADDTEMQTPGGLQALVQTRGRAEGVLKQEIGILSCAIMGTCGKLQTPQEVRSARYGFMIAPCKDMHTTVWFPSVLLKGSLIKAIGGFDESLVGYACEDTDYCFRATKAGFLVGTSRHCVSKHNQEDSVFLKNKDYSRLWEEGRAWNWIHGQKPCPDIFRTRGSSWSVRRQSRSKKLGRDAIQGPNHGIGLPRPCNHG